MAYAKSDLDLIRSKIDILTYLEDRGITFRESGTTWVGLCPVHNERTPSFNVKPETQTFVCYGCGIHGDIYALVQEMDSLSFPGAVQALAAEAGVELQMDEDPNYKHRLRLQQIVRMTAEWYRHNYNNLPPEHLAKQNLAERNLLDFSYLDQSVGYAPAGELIGLLTKKGFSLEEIIAAGLASKSDDGRPYERFRNRLTWTIYDVQGNPIGFSARQIFDNDKGSKYINSPQTMLYNKSKALLGLSDAKKIIAKEQRVYVVEGQTDVMAFKAAGRHNTVASCGTAFGAEHANMLLHLSKLGKDSQKFEIIFCFDGDEAGFNAARKVYNNNPGIHLNSSVVSLTNADGSKTDPCDYRRDNGDAKLMEMVDNNRVSIVEFILKDELNQWDVTRPEGQSGFIAKAREHLALVNDPIQYSAYLRLVSYWSGVPLAQLSSMGKPRPQAQKPTRQQNNGPAPQVDSAMEEFEKGDEFEYKILAAILQYPKESFDAMTKFKVGANCFPTRRDFALKLIDQVEEKTVDYSDKRIAALDHVDLRVLSDRKDFGVDMLFKNYMKHLYNKELAEVNAKYAAESANGSATAFFELMNEQKNLKAKYSVS